MRSVDDCFIHDSVFYLLDMPIGCVSHSFENVSFLSIIVFGLVVMDF